MNQTCPGEGRQSRQAVGQQRVDRQSRQGVIGLRQLLNQSDAVDHHIGAHPAENLDKVIVLLDVNAHMDVRPQGYIEIAKTRRTACGAMGVKTWALREQTEYGVTQHAGDAKH
jgi:hypothetical protein